MTTLDRSLSLRSANRLASGLAPNPWCNISVPDLHDATLFTAVYAWDRPVVNFTQADVSSGITNGAVQAFRETDPGLVYEVDILGDPAPVTLELAAGAANDADTGEPSVATPPVLVPYVAIVFTSEDGDHFVTETGEFYTPEV